MNRNDTDTTPWDFEGYWNTVLGAYRTAAMTVAEFGLVAAGLDEWLDTCEAEAARVGGIAIPAEWADHHARTVRELEAAIRAAAE